MVKSIVILIMIFFMVPNLFAFENTPKLTDREIIESFAELKAGQSSIDKRFDDMGKRIDDMGKRIDGMGDRINDIGNRFGDIQGLLYAILTGIFVLFGYILWDRRTAITPAVKKSNLIEKALIEYSDEHPKLKRILRNIGLL